MAILQDALFIKLASSSVLLMALIVTRIQHRRSATQRGRVLVIGLLVVTVLPLLTLVLPSPVANPPVEQPVLPAAGPSGALSDPTSRTGADAARELSAGVSRTGTRPVSDRHINPMIWLVCAAVLWLVGAVTVLVRLLRSHAMARRLVQATEPVSIPELLTIHDRLCLQHVQGRQVPLRQTALVTSPMTVGWLRPQIVLPDEARQWPVQTVKAVLHHELTHVARHDNLFRVVGDIISILHWFDPLIWLVLSRLRYEAELACDDSVVRSGMRSSAYARVLLERSLEAPLVRPLVTPAVPFACHAKKRLQSLLDPGVDRRLANLRTSLSITVLLLAVTLPLTPLRSSVMADPDDVASLSRADAAAVFMKQKPPPDGPDWWREFQKETREFRAISKYTSDPSLGTVLPDNITHVVAGGWTVSTRDAVFMPGAKYGCLFTSTEGYARISRIENDRLIRFGVAALVHPPVNDFEHRMDRVLTAFGMGCDGDFRAYSIEQMAREEQVDTFREVLTLFAASLRAPYTFGVPEE